MIELCNVSKIKNDKKILNEINLKLPSKGLVVIKGLNGAGKTTLVNLIGGLDVPNSGKILFNGIDISSLSSNKLSEYREKYISFIFQDNNLFENMSVLDNINITNKSNNIKSTLEEFNLNYISNQKAKSLSGGQQKKVAITRALSKNSTILICDEPTSSLDSESRINVLKKIKSISRNKLVLLISHEDIFIDNYADMLIELNEGNLQSVVETKQLYYSIEKSNSISKNNFNIFDFLIKNLFSNKKKLYISGFFMFVSFLFILFSVSLSLLNYDEIHLSMMDNLNDDLIIFNKNSYNESNDSYINEKEFFVDDVDYIASIDKNMKIITGYNINVDGYSMNFGINYNQRFNVPYYQKFVNRLSFINYDDINYNSIIGNKPLLKNEIVISSYLADIFIKYGVMTSGKQTYFPKDYDDLISSHKELILGSNNVVVSGIYLLDLEKFNVLKNEVSSLNSKNSRLYELFSQVIDNTAGNIFVNNEFFELYSNVIPVINVNYDFSLEEKDSTGKNTILDSKPIIFTEKVSIADGDIVDELNVDEIIINNNILKSLNLEDEEYIGKSITLYIFDSLSGNIDYLDKITLKIKGLSEDNDYYISKDSLNKYIDKIVYINKIFTINNSSRSIKNTFEKFPLQRNQYTITTNYSQIIIGLSGILSILKIIFSIISIVFILFTLFFIANYLFNSIEFHKKDIGILKSLGIKDWKIVYLFILELLSILLFAYIFSIIMYIIVCHIVNNILGNFLNIYTSYFSLNFKILLLIPILIFIILIIFYILYSFKIRKINPEILFRES